MIFPSFDDWQRERSDDLREEFMEDNDDGYDRAAYMQWCRLKYDQEKLRHETFHRR